MPEALICRACGSEKARGPITVWGDSILYECMDCGVQSWFGASNPGSVWYDTASHYETRYWHLYREPTAYLCWNHHEALKRLPPPPQSLLDIGCGIGAFVAVCRAKGYDAHGIDFSSRAIETGRLYFGISELYPLALEEYLAKNVGATFDIVTFFEVLEHLEAPGDFLRSIYSIVKSNGHIVLSVPNRDRRPNVHEDLDYPPYHLTWWNVTSLKKFLSTNGFTPLSIAQAPTWFSVAAVLNLLMDRVSVVSVVKTRLARRSVNTQRSITMPGWVRLLARIKKLFILMAAYAISPLLFPWVRGARLSVLAKKDS